MVPSGSTGWPAIAGPVAAGGLDMLMYRPTSFEASFGLQPPTRPTPTKTKAVNVNKGNWSSCHLLGTVTYCSPDLETGAGGRVSRHQSEERQSGDEVNKVGQGEALRLRGPFALQRRKRSIWASLKSHKELIKESQMSRLPFLMNSLWKRPPFDMAPLQAGD